MSHSTKANLAFNSIYLALNSVLSLATAPFLARVLGAGGVGEYAYNFSVTYFFMLVAKFGLNNYGTREIAKVRGDAERLDRTFSGLFGLQVFVTLIVSFVYILYIIFFSDGHCRVAVAMSPLVFLSFLDIDWFWFGLEEFGRVTLRNSVTKACTAVLVFALVRSADDVSLYAGIMVVGSVLGFLSNWLGLSKRVCLSLTAMFNFPRHLMPCSVLAVPALAMNMYRSMDKVMLGSLASMTAAGIYENGEKLVYGLYSVITSFGNVMLPKMSRLVERDCDCGVERRMHLSMRVMVIITSLLSFGLVAMSDSLVLLFFGDEFAASALVLRIVAPTMLFVGCASVVRTHFIIPMKLDHIQASSIIVAALLNVLLNVCLIPRYGAVGAALDTLLTEAFVFVIQVVFLRWKIDFKDLLVPCLPYVLFGALACACAMAIQEVLGVSELLFIPQAVVGVLVSVSCIVIWAWRKDEMVWSFVTSQVIPRRGR